MSQTELKKAQPEGEQHTRRILLDPPEGEHASLYHGLRFGNYQIESKLGGGGMGVVYLARDISMRRFVALKVLHPLLSRDKGQAADQISGEMRLLTDFEHPGLVRIFDAGILHGIQYFVMESVNGKDLKKILEEQGPFNPEQTLQIAEQTAQLLTYVWQKANLVHRDIKPANLMLTPENTVKVLDLGISRCFSGYIDPLSGEKGKAVGSPHYLAPEQAMGCAYVDCRADMYSLGITLFQLLTGSLPFDGSNHKEIILKHLNEPLPSIRKMRQDLCPELIALIEKLTEKIPENRFDSWDLFLEQLQYVKNCQLQYVPAGNSISNDNGDMAEQSTLPDTGEQKKRYSKLTIFLFSIFSATLLLAGSAILLYGMNPEIFTGIISDTPEKNADPLLTHHNTAHGESYQERRDQWLSRLRQQSYQYEADGDFKSALACWTDQLAVPEEFQDDPVILREIRISVLYLQDLLQKTK